MEDFVAVSAEGPLLHGHSSSSSWTLSQIHSLCVGFAHERVWKGGEKLRIALIN